jgi:Mrp family chromosome partitioning ATPase
VTDGVLLVVHGGKSSRAVVRHARQQLHNVGAKILGVVMNKVDLRESNYYYPYSYGYYSAEGDGKELAPGTID